MSSWLTVQALVLWLICVMIYIYNINCLVCLPRMDSSCYIVNYGDVCLCDALDDDAFGDESGRGGKWW